MTALNTQINTYLVGIETQMPAQCVTSSVTYFAATIVCVVLYMHLLLTDLKTDQPFNQSSIWQLRMVYFCYLCKNMNNPTLLPPAIFSSYQKPKAQF